MHQTVCEQQACNGETENKRALSDHGCQNTEQEKESVDDYGKARRYEGREGRGHPLHEVREPAGIEILFEDMQHPRSNECIEDPVHFGENELDRYFSTASLRAQIASTMVIGAKIRFSKEMPDARFPNVFKIKYTNMTQTPILIAFLNLLALI